MCDQNFSKITLILLRLNQVIPNHPIKIFCLNLKYVTIGVFIISMCYNLISEFIDKFSFDKSFLLFLDILRLLVTLDTSIINIYSVLVAQIFYRTSWDVLSASISQNKPQRRKSDMLFLFMVMVYNLKYISIFIYKGQNLPHLFKHYQIDIVNDYMLIMVMVVINNLASCLAHEIKLSRKKFIEKTKLIIKIKRQDMEEYIDVDDILKDVIRSLKGIEAFNRVFGWQFVAIVGLILLNTTHNVIVTLQVVIREGTTSPLRDVIRSTLAKLVMFILVESYYDRSSLCFGARISVVFARCRC